ncbi:MAG: class I SAM-dependent methyltransferase [Desulfonauticus sp.]|nr:class I SAM-dependent methyltransferase [Desulfonauticus sp.]
MTPESDYTWTKEQVLKYEQWLYSKQGSFILKQEQKLLSHLLSPWPRRRQSFVDLGCGPGSFLNFFWKCGFEVHGVDKNPEMLKIARKATKGKIPLTLGDLTHLPFDDDEFDFGSLILVLEFTKAPQRVLEEAKRIVKKGLLVGFLNKYSFYYLEKKVLSKGNPLAQARWYSWLEMKKLLTATLAPESIYARSVLPGPTCIWQDKKIYNFAHKFIYPVLCGSFIGVRLDFLKTVPLCTPLLVQEDTCQPVGN